MAKELWFFLQFPYNLSIVFLIAWFYTTPARKQTLLAGSIVFLSASFLLEGSPRTLFWFPSGASTVILGAVFTLVYYNMYSLKYAKALKIPTNVSWDRSILKQELLHADHYENRQRIYLDFVKKFNLFLKEIDHQMGSYIKKYFLLSLAILFFVNFGYWFIQYWNENLQITQFFDQEKIANLVKNEKNRAEILEFYGKHKQAIINYIVDQFAFITMVSNTISLFLILSIIRWVKSKHNPGYFFWLDICFFKLPESTILIYIPTLGLFILSSFYNILPGYSLWFKNLFLIMSFLYLLNGIAILRIYIKVRFLPFWIVFSILFISSWFMPILLILCTFSLVMTGLLDFIFDLRKKALHHISIRE